MNRRRRPAVQCEPLEGKLLLSTVHIAAPSPPAQVQAAPQAFILDGTLRTPVRSIKTFVSNEGNRLGTYSVSGKLKGLGQVNGTYVAALDAESHVIGTGGLTLTNRKGSVILTLENDPTDTTSYKFTVKGGTGSFASAKGTGKMATSGATPNGLTLFFALRTDKA